MKFDYSTPAELFMAKRKGARAAARLSPLHHRRGGHPIRVEDFPAMRTLGAWMQVGDHRLTGRLQRLVQKPEYPCTQRSKLEHFQEKWNPGFRPKMRQHKMLERFHSIK